MKKYLGILLLGSAFFATAQNDKELAAATVNKSTLEAHIRFLSSDALRGRETGTNDELVAAEYLATMLRAYGAKEVPGATGYMQKIPLVKTTAPKTATLTVNGENHKELLQIQGGNSSFDGAAVFMNYGLEDDYQGQDVTGKMVLVKAGSEKTTAPQQMFALLEEKKALAKKHGAKAVVELADAEPMLWSYLKHNFSGERIALEQDKDTKNEESFPYLWLLDKGHELANDLGSKRSIFSTLKVSGIEEIAFHSQNVVAMIEGSDPKLKEEFIIYSGHYDHEGVGQPDSTGDSIYNGARDNAVGVTTVLSMAENLAKHPTKRSALFILFGAEEKGLLGSEYYVENPLLPLHRMVYCFNSDNAGYDDTSKVTVVGLNRTSAKEDFRVAASAFNLEAVGDPDPAQNLFERSDNVHFAAKGIPAPTFAMGITSFSGKATEHYHQPSDEADTIDYDYLEQFFKVYVLAGRLIGNTPEKPFWVEGDKYEAAGKALYKN